MDRSTVSKLIASLKDESIITAEQYVEVSGSLSCAVIITSWVKSWGVWSLFWGPSLSCNVCVGCLI